MDFKNFKKQYSSFDLYKQAAAVKPLYIGFPYKACFDFTVYGKKIPLSYNGMVTYFRHDYMEVYFPVPVLEKISQYFLTNRKKPFHFLKYLKQNWDKNQVPQFLKMVKSIESLDLTSLSDQQLVKEFLSFSKIYHQLWQECIFHDAFDAQGDNILEQVLVQEKASISKRDLHTLTSPVQYSWMQKEKLSLLSLVAEINKNNRLKQAAKKGVISLANEFPDFFRRLADHSKKFHWMHNDYAITKNLDAGYFLNELLQLVTNPAKLKHGQDELSGISKIKNNKKQLINKYNISRSFIETLNSLLVISAWRDDRKTYNQMANAVLNKFATEFSRRSKYSTAEVEDFFWWEIPSTLNPKKELRGIHKKRNHDFFILNKPNSYTEILYGKQAANLNTFLNKSISDAKELKGRTAFPGIVTGKIKIIRNQSEFKKMKSGDILVAANTRPEYVPIMKIAGAIISEEGGLTCHAAIVSRELKKPCIVGAQGIMHKLKDNDLVEVNATLGTVKIIKKY
jgi:phosphohistidine swiveling domain-containing protein